MINKKVAKHMEQVLLYIKNRLTVGATVNEVVCEVINRFKVELAFFDTTLEMKENFIEVICMQEFRHINNRLQNEYPNKDRR